MTGWLRRPTRAKSAQRRKSLVMLGSSAVPAALFVSDAVTAQALSNKEPPALISADPNGVDLGSGDVAAVDILRNTISIGDPSFDHMKVTSLAFSPLGTSGIPLDSAIYECHTDKTVASTCSDDWFYFTVEGAQRRWVAKDASSTTTGEAVIWSNSEIRLFLKDGSTWIYDKNNTAGVNPNFPDGRVGRLKQISYANGVGLSFTYVNNKLNSVVSNTGYQLHVDWELDLPAYRIIPSKLQIFNMAEQYCDPSATRCDLSRSDWPMMINAQYLSDGVFTTATTTQSARATLVRTADMTKVAPGSGGTYEHTVISPMGVSLTYTRANYDNVNSNCPRLGMPLTVTRSGRRPWTYTWYSQCSADGRETGNSAEAKSPNAVLYSASMSPEFASATSRGSTIPDGYSLLNA